MILNIIAADITWKNVVDLAKILNRWEEIKIIHVNEDGYDKELDINEDNEYIIASDVPYCRKEQFQKLESLGAKFATLIYPENFIYPETKLGKGIIVYQGVIIYCDSQIFDNVVLKAYSSISHDSRVGCHTIIMEKCTVAGRAVIGEQVFMGAGSVVKEESIIGNMAHVECGSVVLRGIEPGSRVMGNPARVVKRRD